MEQLVYVDRVQRVVRQGSDHQGSRVRRRRQGPVRLRRRRLQQRRLRPWRLRLLRPVVGVGRVQPVLRRRSEEPREEMRERHRRRRRLRGVRHGNRVLQ